MAEKEISVEEKLKALFEFQEVMSKIDSIRTLRGELPLEVQDLEDEIVGLETRIENFSREIEDFETKIAQHKNEIEEWSLLIERYKEQQNNVRNNREYDSLSKEIEFKELEIQLAEKRIKEFAFEIKSKKEIVDSSKAHLTERTIDLNGKKSELDEIIHETRTEEESLRNHSLELEERIEPRLLAAFKRIRKNARNGLGVVSIERDACGGCFAKIPAQRQLDIKLRKKIIVCEYCGRILVDNEMKSE